MEKYNDFLDTIKSENTRNAVLVILKKLERFIDGKNIKRIGNIPPEFVDLFLKKECSGKSETTISNTISRMKLIFSYYHNKEAVSHLSLNYVKQILEYKEPKYYTPSEIHCMIEDLLNFQDKVLILLTYLGLYDNNFNIIRNLRKDQYFDKKLYLEDKTIELSDYSANIIEKAIEETVVDKYIFSGNKVDETYRLRDDTPYIIKTKDRKGAADLVPVATIKKRFILIARYLDDEDITPVAIKNSRMIYDLVKLEFKENYGFDINQVELKNYMKDNNMKGTIEKINMSKKEIKKEIISDIIFRKDFFI